MNADYRPDPAILALGDGAPFYDAVKPAQFPKHILRFRNQRWAERVGLGGLSDEEWVEHFGRFRPFKDNLPEPLALRYHGHQFRAYNPEIGDGRGFLYAQLRDGERRLLDLGTKGSGQTPYSRTADGRLTLKGGVREILATEMLEALGVYTSKTFSLIETGEALTRHDEPSPTRASVLVRLSHSHVRFGTFQRLAFEGNAQAIETLVDYCIRHFDAAADLPPLRSGGGVARQRDGGGESPGPPPPAQSASPTAPPQAGEQRRGASRIPGGDQPAIQEPRSPPAPPFQGGELDRAQGEKTGSIVRFYARVVARTARLVGQWMAAGFVHGVLNSDNMTITGESFDYGPWRFAPAADPSFTAAYFDHSGLYAFGRQAEAAAWNLARLGGCLTLVADTAALNAALATFANAYQEGMAEAFFRRLGLKRTGTDDFALVSALLRWMEATRVPYERPFFDWFCGRASERRAAASPVVSLYAAPEFAEAKSQLLAAEPDRPERLAHAYFAGAPCTMLIDEVEAIWAKIAEADDWSALGAKLAEIADLREALSIEAVYLP